MNILFITSFLLLTLSIIAGKAFLSAQTLSTEKTSLLGRCQGIVQTRNMMQTRLFITSTKTAQNSAKATSQAKRIRPLSSHRHGLIKVDMSKLSIAPLFTEELEAEKNLFKVTCDLLDILYSHCPFIQKLNNEDWQKDLLQIIIKEGKKASGDIDLSKMAPSQESMATIYYKMMKGTPGYNLEKKIGIPPLTDFITTLQRRKPVFFSYASYPVLQAVFGEKIAQHILDEETERSRSYGGRRVLSKEEVLHIVTEKNPHTSVSIQVDEMFLFAKKFIPLEGIVYTDSASQVFFIRKL